MFQDIVFSMVSIPARTTETQSRLVCKLLAKSLYAQLRRKDVQHTPPNTAANYITAQQRNFSLQIAGSICSGYPLCCLGAFVNVGLCLIAHVQRQRITVNLQSPFEPSAELGVLACMIETGSKSP